jgi:hypothetical protein
MPALAEKLEPDFALSLTRDDRSDSGLWWSGWKRRHWPAKKLRPGLRFYAYDKQTKTLFALLEVVRGAAFTYRTKREFSKKVKEVTGRWPRRDHPHWRRLPLPKKRERATGYAIRWKKIKPVNIPWYGRFPQLGWARLSSNKPPHDSDLLQAFVEGDRVVRRHLEIERNATLRARAKKYWSSRLGGLRCLVCGFDFKKTYGPAGDGFIEMHHDTPLNQRKSGSKTKVKDLKPLCANCHRIVHRDVKRPLSLKALKGMLRRTAARAVGAGR